jgi:hypothetical protein
MKRYPEEPKQKRVASPMKELQPRQSGFSNLKPVSTPYNEPILGLKTEPKSGKVKPEMKDAVT